MKIPDMSKLENLLTFIIIYVSCVNFDTIIISIETKMLGKLTKLRVLHLGDFCPAHHRSFKTSQVLAFSQSAGTA